VLSSETENLVMPANEKSIELGNGVTLRYAERGRSSGLPLLLLPGLGDSWRSFEPVLEHLPDSIRAFALTLRGHGDATHPEDGYAFQDFSDDLHALLDALDLRVAVIAAHSASGFFAQRFALDHPKRVLGLVFIASPLTLRNHAGLHDAWDSVISKLADPVDPGFVRELQAGTLAKPVPEEFFETLVAEAMKVPARVWKQAFQHLLEKDLSDEISNIHAPTLIVWGDQDQVVPRNDQDALAAAIGDSRLILYEGAGHSPHWEQPNRFAADLASFLGDLG
jgi:non-heme chloroperoxidase